MLTTPRRLTRALSAALFALGAAWAPLRAQTVLGTLKDRESDRPIAFGRVLLLTETGDSVAATLTNPEGRFSLEAERPGSYLLRASGIGHKETTAGVFDLTEGGSVTVEFRIYAVPINLEEIIVRAPGGVRPGALIANGFFDRMKMGLGRFITPADIAKPGMLEPLDLLWGIPRVNIEQSSGGERAITIQAPLGQCSPPLYVDGMLVSRAATDRDLPPLVAIEAIEVYRGAAETPLQWGGTAAQGCGVIVVWTKR